MLRASAMALVMALLPLAGAEPLLYLPPGDAPLATSPEPGAIALLPDGDRDPLLYWTSDPLDATYLHGKANVTLYWQGEGGPRFISLMVVDENGTVRILAAAMFGTTGPLPAHETLALDLHRETIRSGERLAIVVRMSDPLAAVLLVGPETPSRIALPAVDHLPPPADPVAKQPAANNPPESDGQPSSIDASLLASPNGAWFLAIPMMVLALALSTRQGSPWRLLFPLGAAMWAAAFIVDARWNGGGNAWWILAGCTVQVAAQGAHAWLRPAPSGVPRPMHPNRSVRPVRQRTPMEGILAAAGPLRIDPLESGPRPTVLRDDTHLSVHAAAEPASIHRVGITPGARNGTMPTIDYPPPLQAPPAICQAPTPDGPCPRPTAPGAPWCGEHRSQSTRVARGPWG